MLTGMPVEDWQLLLRVFSACQSRRGDEERDDRLFLEAMHFFTVENVAGIDFIFRQITYIGR